MMAGFPGRHLVTFKKSLRNLIFPTLLIADSLVQMFWGPVAKIILAVTSKIKMENLPCFLHFVNRCLKHNYYIPSTGLIWEVEVKERWQDKKPS